MAKKGKLKAIAEKETRKRPVRFKRYEYLFLIVCEDEKTEPSYFEKYKKQIPAETLYLKTIGAGKDPKGVVKQAVLERNNLAREAKKEVDAVWVVFDKDDADENLSKISNFDNAFETAKDEKIDIAFSNEVFELWLLIHFKNIQKELPLSRKEIYQLLKEEFQKFDEYSDYEYNHKKIDPRTLQIVFEKGNRDKAIERAVKLKEYHNNTKPINANPSTDVHILVQNLLEWITYYSYEPSK